MLSARSRSGRLAVHVNYFYFTPVRGEQVVWWLCPCVCLSVREDIYETTHAIFTKLFVLVVYGCGSVLLRCRCGTLCTSGFVVDIMFFFYNGSYCGMNFATKHRFRLNLVIYRTKSGRIDFPIIKWHNFDYIFRNYSQTGSRSGLFGWT